jgi:Integrase core domain
MAIVDMAQRGAVEGMTIDLSSTPLKCNHCILRKQMHSLVPKVWEGVQASHLLECVFVDLCGPMASCSHSGHLYLMNVIDDYSSYVWSLPLRNKSKAASILKIWHCVVENQSGHCLKILITDNGELISKSIENWCEDHGIDHNLTAPYTSAHNSHAECLHQTILDKARTMCLACNAPTSFWDKFCTTAAYLTNLTPSSSIQGRTPFELWFGHKPSLLHLHEISCRAFTLI